MMTNVDQNHWYALYLRSRHEAIVDVRLREMGVETFLPMIEEVRQYSDRKKQVLEPLFKGYLFARTTLKDRIPILQTEGVVRFVGIGNKPSPIPEKQIVCLRIAGGQPSRVKRAPFLTTGEHVRVIEGPFKGIQGYVLEVRGSLRVVVSVDCIGQSLSVEVPPASVATIPS